MISYPITVDGVTYPHIHVTDIGRNFSVLDGDGAGRVKTGGMVRAVIGTFYNYSFTIDADGATPEEYDSFYEVISSPEDSHSIVVPYAQRTLTFNAYITNGSDKLLDMGQANRWGNLTINIIAMAPQRT